MTNAALRDSAIELMTAIATNPNAGPFTQYRAEQNLRKWGAAPSDVGVNHSKTEEILNNLFGGFGKGKR